MSVTEIVPDKFWLIRSGKKPCYWGDGKESIYVFTDEAHAKEYVDTVCLDGAFPVEMNWNDIVGQFGSYLQFALIDPVVGEGSLFSIPLIKRDPKQ